MTALIILGAIVAGQLPELARVIAADRKDARQKKKQKDDADRAAQRSAGGTS